MRDFNTLQRKASAHGEHVGAYAAAVLEHPLPWTKMRQVYRLLGLVRRHGAGAVDDACRRALDAEVIDVGLIERMLTQGAGAQLPLIPTPPTASRFVRDTNRVHGAEAIMSAARPDATPAVKPIEVSPELKALMRRLNGQLLDTLPNDSRWPDPTGCPITISWRCC